MPCNSDYMDPNGLEIQVSRLCCIMDEIKNGTPISKSEWAGYHPRAYMKNPTSAQRDALTAKICKHLKKTGAKNYSLEVQMWWRDHQAADAAREQSAKEAKRRRKIRKAAEAKLSDEELLSIRENW